MNKFFIAAASALALASCSSDDFLGEIQGNEQNGATSAINFGGDTGKITRATTKGNAAAELLENNFSVSKAARQTQPTTKRTLSTTTT